MSAGFSEGACADPAKRASHRSEHRSLRKRTTLLPETSASLGTGDVETILAVILVLAFGILGFTLALTSLLFFGASLMQALGLWPATGFGAMLLAPVPILLPRRDGGVVRIAERT